MTDRGGGQPKARDFEVLEYIAAHAADKGYPPTMAEIAERFGMKSKATAVFSVARLQRAGYVAVEPHKARAVRVASPGPGDAAGGV